MCSIRALHLWLAVFMAMVVVAGCSKEEQSPEQELEEAAACMAGTDFGETFDRCLAVLDELAQQKGNRGLALRAIHERALAHLGLFVAAILSGDEELYEKTKKVLSWRLERGLFDPRNFQLLAQEIMEEFRVVVREGEGLPEIRKRAAALDLYCEGLQGILFRSKKGYFDGRDAVGGFLDLEYLDDLMAARDLTHEVLTRAARPEDNWQNVVLTAVGRVCFQAAARYLDLLCTAVPGEAAGEYCATDLGRIPAARREAGARYLADACRWEDGEGGERSGREAVRGYYEQAFERLGAVQDRLPVPTRAAVERMRGEKEKALEALGVLFGVQ